MGNRPSSNGWIRLAFTAWLAAPIPAQITYEDAFSGVTFRRPVYIGTFPGEPHTFVVLEQHVGEVTLVRPQGTTWVKTQFLKISVGTENEEGLLGIAFHPEFRTNRRYFINYNPPGSPKYNIVAERQANAGFSADAGTQRIVLRVPDPAWNHNGGTIAFHPQDRYLYVGMGDGGSTPETGQDRHSLLGKFLRLDINGPDAFPADPDRNYAIPSDNPFAGGGGAPEIWALGFRNPWKWSFDPLTGDLWAGDVGQGAWEEVDIVRKGQNYGWPLTEGNHCYATGCDPNAFARPVFEYGRAGGNSITGGVVFRGNPSSPYYGSFIFGDYGSNNVWALRANGQATPLPSTSGGLASFGVDARGQVYVAGRDNGVIRRMTGPGLEPLSLRPGLFGERFGRTYYAKPGDRLDLKAFAAGSVDLYSLQGSRVATLSSSRPVLPRHVQAGLYLLRTHAGTKPHLLVVGS